MKKSTMLRDRSRSVQELSLSKSLPLQSQQSLPGTSHPSSDPGTLTRDSNLGRLGQSVIANRSTIVSMAGPNVTSGAGARRTLPRTHLRQVAICHYEKTLFYHMDQNRPLAGILQDICDKWNLPNTEDYALQFSEPARQTCYITERNRTEINNGNVLQLTDSPGRSAQIIIDKLEQGSREDKIDSLKSLCFKCTDATFAHKFIHKNGLKLIIGYVTSGPRTFSGDPLTFLLRSFIALMEHNVVSWDVIEPDFTKQVATCVSGARAAGDGCIQPALEILESVILHSTDKAKMESLEQHITPDKIIPYMQSSSSDIQRSALALINAMFIKSSPDKKQRLADSFQSRTFRNVITASILGSAQLGSEMAHQLYKLQRLLLNMYEARMNTTVNNTDTTQVATVNKEVEELRRIAFDFADISDTSSGPSRKAAGTKDYKKLGFSNQEIPLVDFDSPPGLLALDNMSFFAHDHKETYIKVVLENCGRASEQDCPFVQASVRLTSVLCELLKIGEPPYEDEHSYLPMFFTSHKPFEEFFSQCIYLLNRTWKEMRASKEDFSKVLSVVKEQITRALDKNQMPKTFEAFRLRLTHLAYPELKKIWEAERQRKENSKRQAKPILELKEIVKPEIVELIRKNRLTYLETGTRFSKYDNRGGRVKNKFQYWRLSPNHKAFCFGDCGENDSPQLEQLPNKVTILEIKQLLTGERCRHGPKNRNRQGADMNFQIVLESSRPDEEQCHYFTCQTDGEYNMWEDGINSLLNVRMGSKQAREDMDLLLEMEIKLRLLETEGITIPIEAPPIPKLPDNFNFAYTTS